MSDLISKRAVLAKINLWANGELSTDKLIESIKKMSGGSLTDRPCEYCKNHVDGWCKAWECVFDDMLSSSEKPNKSGQWIERVERDDWDDYEEVWYECDQCHVGSERVSNYCPACGAKMSEGSEKE